MYLWKVDSLVEDLKSGRVTQLEQFKYFLLSTVFWGVLLYIPDSENLTAGFLFLEFAVSMAVSVAGVLVCYRRNSAGDDADFVLRMACLAIPVSVRVLVFFFLVGIFLGVVMEAMSVGEETGDMLISLLAIIVSVAMWAYLASKIRNVSAR